jgi:hypothetical protein
MLKRKKKWFESTRLTCYPCNYGYKIGITPYKGNWKKKKKHEDRSPKNQILKSEIEKNKLKWQKKPKSICFNLQNSWP